MLLRVSDMAAQLNCLTAAGAKALSVGDEHTAGLSAREGC